MDLQSALAQQIGKYIKKDKRSYRVVLSLSEEEMLTLRESADNAGTKLATFARAACMLGAIAYLRSTGGPNA